MFKKGLILSLLFFCLCLAGCSKYQKILKGTDMEKKYEAAMNYYNQGDYFRALTLFEELIGVFRATKKAENIYFYYAYCYFHQKEYELASFHFENFVKTFTNSEHTEECLFMTAYCNYLNSPGPTLDQESTNKAISGFQLFVNRFPQSSKVAQCNDLIDMLREKLQTKDFENAKLYYDMGDYKASVIAFRNLIKEYPLTKYREECLFLISKSYYLLATNSIETKKEERYKSAIQAYYTFLEAFPSSRYQKEAKEIHSSSLKEIEKIKQTN